MKRSSLLPSGLLRSVALGGLLMTGACALEGVAPQPVDNNGDDLPVRIPADDPEIDARLDALGIICESTLKVTGTYVQGAAPPADHLGCWPVGTWTVNMTVDRLGCDPQPSLETDYVYDITFDEEANTINVSFVNDPDNERQNLKISTAGDSLCHGAMEHFGTDFATWSLQPTLQLDGSLEGIGTYTVNEKDPF